jgi:PAS domain S-box-containing protein
MSGSPDRLQALCGIVEFLASLKETDDDRAWSRILDKLAAALDCEAGTYFVYLAKPNQIVSRHVLGEAGAATQTRRVESGQGLCGWVAKYREPLVVENAEADHRYLKSVDTGGATPTRRALVMPVYDRMELTGVLELVNKRAGAFDGGDLAFVEAACRAASLALRGLKLESTVDKVTAHNASILDNLGGGFVAIDAHGRLMLCNPAARKLLGLAEDLELGRPVDQSLSMIPEMGELLMDTLVKKETVKRQDLWWKRDGQTRVLGYSTLLIQDPRGQVVGAGITFQDITQFQKGQA